MKKFTPFLLLIPVVVLLAGLPSQLHGKLSYHISTFSYVASISHGYLFSAGFFPVIRRPKWSWLFWVLVALDVLVKAVHGLWIGQNGLVYFLFQLVVGCIFIAIAFAVSPSFRKSTQFSRR
jgi:hypothetical protein